MIQKICITLFALLLLISCGDDDTVTGTGSIDATTNKKGVELFETSSFALGVPAAWEIIQDVESLLPKPNNGFIELAVRSVDTQNGFANNLLVLSQDLNKPTSSKDFAILNNVGVEREYYQYLLLDKSNITFGEGNDSLVYVFEAKYNIDSPKLRFVQTASVCSATKGYLLTVAVPANITDTQRYIDLLGTFRCK